MTTLEKNNNKKLKNENEDDDEFNKIELPDSLKGIMDELENDASFHIEVEKILLDTKDQDLDLTKIQAKILLLLQKFLFSAQDKNTKTTKFKEILKERELIISEHLKTLSLYLMNQNIEQIKNCNIEIPKDKNEYLNQKSRENLKQIIRRFVIYEAYKILNPRQIAGERRRENFVSNAILRGVEEAKKYAGGTTAELKTYSPKFINQLGQQHKHFKKNQGKGI